MNSKNISTIFAREYRTRVYNKMFVLGTLLVPILYLALSFVPTIVMSMGESEGAVVAIVDRTGLYGDVFESNDNYTFVLADKSLRDYKEGKAGDGEQEFAAVLEIRQDLLEHPEALSLFSEGTLPKGLESYINRHLSSYLSDQKIASYDIPELRHIIQESKVNIQVSTFRWQDDSNQAVSSSEMLYAGMGFVVSLVLNMLILMYSFMFMQSVLEEKTNRIMEVMLTSVQPFELMMGKLLGVMGTVVTQLAIWAVLIGGISVGVSALLASMASAEMAGGQLGGGDLSMVGDLMEQLSLLSSINFFELGIFILLYFIGGFLLYASVLGAIAASVSSQEDAQSLARPVSLLLVIATYIGIGSVASPESDLAFWTSMIPFTSPFVMITRICFGVPLWQELLSVALLYLTTVGIVAISARIYRVGALMYGKKPTVRELIRWIRY